MGAVTLPLRFGELMNHVKFYIIDADTSYKALIGRPWLHENNAVPSTLHQCIKYIKDGKVKQIKGDAHPFEVHEVGLKDAKYFLSDPTRKTNHTYTKASQQTRKQILYGGDTDSSSEDEERISKILPSYMPSSDEEEMGQHSLAIERMPKQHYKTLPPREVHQVQELKVFVVPSKSEITDEGKIIHKPIIFYRSVVDPCVVHPRSDDEWLLEDNTQYLEMSVPLPKWSTKSLPFIMQKMGCPNITTKTQMDYFNKLWSPVSQKVLGLDGQEKKTRGLGYVGEGIIEDHDETEHYFKPRYNQPRRSTYKNQSQRSLSTSLASLNLEEYQIQNPTRSHRCKTSPPKRNLNILGTPRAAELMLLRYGRNEAKLPKEENHTLNEEEQIDVSCNMAETAIAEMNSEIDESEYMFEEESPCMICLKIDKCYKQFTCNECMETCHSSCWAALEEEIYKNELDPRYNFWRCEECDIIYSAIEARLRRVA